MLYPLAQSAPVLCSIVAFLACFDKSFPIKNAGKNLSDFHKATLELSQGKAKIYNIYFFCEKVVNFFQKKSRIIDRIVKKVYNNAISITKDI